ncbi:MAG: SH3 domain-containing protein [Candidatus Omnitrophota bacterium]|nr:SH3 domain-containing protein [Candidatus Omnitrophota bacterium]
MKYLKSLIIALSLFALTTAYAEEEAKEKFPKIGHVKNDGAAVKSGDNVNFESLCVMSKSDSVKVIDRRYSWLKILLPRKAFLYINKDYVDLTSDEKGVGIVSASNVNLRAGSGTRYSIAGQVSKPEKISIVSEDNGWYKIEPPYGTTGWIHSDQVTLAEETETPEIKEVRQAEPRQEPKEIKKTAEVKSEPGSTVRLNAGYPSPKGNLSISTSTKNNR